jgi:dTDP-4-amino-4,6-dideoxygalactose transaminase
MPILSSPRSASPVFPPWPSYTQEEIHRVAAVLSSNKVNYWTGQEGRLFEKEFAAAVGCRFGVALSNGSVALELALRSLGIGPGDEVIVPARSFIASASCVILCGATPVFADIDRNSQNLTSRSIEKAMSRRTKAIICVHLAGWPCEMDKILALADTRGIKVIEDCAQAHGSKYKQRSVGSWGHVAAWSFCQDKIMTTGGEGGFLTTNSEMIWQIAWSYKDHGKSWHILENQKAGHGFQWVHESVGTNFRMTEIQAAIGRIQIGRLPDWVKRRRQNAQVLNDRFRAVEGLRTTEPPPECYHSYYKYYVFIKDEVLSKDWNRDRIIRHLQRDGIPVITGICPEIYAEKAFMKSESHPPTPLPTAKDLGETSLMLPVHPTMKADHMHKIADSVVRVVSKAMV